MPGFFDDIPLNLQGPTPGEKPPTTRLRVTPLQSSEQAKEPVKPTVSTTKDVLRSIPAGLDEGVAGLAGFPAWAGGGLQKGLNYLKGLVQGRDVSEIEAEQQDPETPWYKRNLVAPETLEQYSPAAIHKASPLYYEPQTTPGEYAKTISSFVPGVVAPELAMGRLEKAKLAGDVFKYGVLPGAASETAGQAARNFGYEDYEPWIRGGVALGTGLGASLASQPSRAQRTVANAIGGKVTPQQVQQAEALFQHANSIGVPMTRATALQHVTGGATNLGNIQRYVEGTGGLTDFYSQLPQGVENVAQKQFGQLGPPNMRPSGLGADVMSTARYAAEHGTPEGVQLGEDVWRAADPSITPERAGNVIQRDLAQVESQREGMRSAQADADFSAARAAPATVPVGGGFRVGTVTEHRAIPEPPPVGRGPGGRFERKTDQQLAVERLEIPKPVGTLKRDPQGSGKWVKKTPDEIEAEKAANEAEMMRAREARMGDLTKSEVRPIIGEPTVYAQVDPTPVANMLDRAMVHAKEEVLPYLERARKSLNLGRTDQLDTTVGGLQSARKVMNDLMQEAGVGTYAAEQLGLVRKELDKALETVPEQAAAVKNYQAASRPLDPFAEDRIAGQITAPREGTPRYPDQGQPRQFEMRPEQAPAAITGQGPTGLRNFQEVATPAAREAYENSFVNDVLNHAGRQGAEINAVTIRRAIQQHEDLLNQMPDVRRRLEAVADSREGYDAVMNSPLGKLSKNPDVKRAMDELFPLNPGANTEREISDALAAVNKKSPQVARDLLNHYLQTRFNQYTRGLQTGANQYGGASFAASVRGNAQQAKNLDAAMRTVYGDKLADGFNKMMDVFAATGARQRVGSPTAFFQEIRRDLEGGGLGAAAVNAAFSSGAGAAGSPAAFFGLMKFGDRAQRAVENLNRTGKLANITRLLTNPNAAAEFQKLALAPPSSQRAIDIVGRLAIMADVASNKSSPSE